MVSPHPELDFFQDLLEEALASYFFFRDDLQTENEAGINMKYLKTSPVLMVSHFPNDLKGTDCNLLLLDTWAIYRFVKLLTFLFHPNVVEADVMVDIRILTATS